MSWMRAWFTERKPVWLHGGKQGERMREELITRSTFSGDTVTVVPPIARVVNVDWARPSNHQVTTYTCSCGWETNGQAEIVLHLKAHGATRVTFIPHTEP